ncbi:expressed unknown protein [Seminavis robusta]|uniref:Uncharacterized protein n=1 Tax=Seminavis robusta TaxID=568900 RepID=A0A9N8HNV9_9STRA|nr:expressed unknown protein [Seminavis robusta]|eukprot:Sro853_g211170.1 n/a (161) ;mRNA; r:36470-36952
MGGDTGSKADPSDDKSWKHFVKVLKLREDQRKAFDHLQIDSIITFYREAGKEDFFQFDDKRTVSEEIVFAPAMRGTLLEAWKWIDIHRTEIENDEDDNWFLSKFGRSFQKQVSKLRRPKLRDEETKRYKITEPNQANASSFTAGGSRTLQGVATFASHIP